jgi:V/A-type H+-transporting ATPase subunit I
MFSTKNVLKVRILGLKEEVEKNREKIKNFIKITGETYKGKTKLISGWLKKKDLNKAKNLASDKILVEVKEPEETKEKIPIDLNNPRILKPFETLIKLYPPPLYSTINPTLFFAFFFLVAFGIMTADVFNGVLLMTLSIIFTFWKKDQRFLLITYMGLSSLIFGFLFGEFLGGLIELPAIWFKPFGNPTKLMMVSLYIGVVEIAIGFVLGIINSFVLKLKSEVLSNAGMLLLLLSGVLFFSFKLISYAFFTVSIILLAVSKDFLKIIEIPHLIGDVFSFLRILAIGLSHIGIAMAFTKVAFMFHFPFSLFFLIFEEAILLTIGLIIAFVHSLRLQFIEFYMKFIRTGENWF